MGENWPHLSDLQSSNAYCVTILPSPKTELQYLIYARMYHCNERFTQLILSPPTSTFQLPRSYADVIPFSRWSLSRLGLLAPTRPMQLGQTGGGRGHVAEELGRRVIGRAEGPAAPPVIVVDAVGGEAVVDVLGPNSIALLKSEQTFQQSCQQSFYSSVGHPVLLETLLKSLLRFEQSY